MTDKAAPISEMIGRSSTQAQSSRVVNLFRRTPTVDRTLPDFFFWDKLRRGKAQGYELGGLFAPAIAEIMGMWALGAGFTVTDGDNDATNAALADFIADNMQTLLDWDYDSKTLGTGYLVVNPDGTLTHVSPDQVIVETEPLDYRKIRSITIVSVIDEPVNFVQAMGRVDFQSLLTYGGKHNIIYDKYTATERTVTIERSPEEKEVTTYPNLIGRIPIIGLHWKKGANEISGHPVVEDLRFLLARYDGLLNKSLDGTEIMGNPIPVAEGLEDVEESKRLNSTTTETIAYADGSTTTQSYVDFNRLEMFWLGKGANFKFASPGSFTADTMNMLQILFLLQLQRNHIPEGVWGGAVASSRASLDAQMPAFVRVVEGWQQYLKPFLVDLCEIWLAYRALIDPVITRREKLTVEYAPIMPKDENVLTVKVTNAKDRGVITDETYLRLLDLVDDPADEVASAADEAQEKQARFEDSMAADIERQASIPNEEEPEAAASA